MEFSLSRFKNIETKRFKCEVVTPMFLGGADGRSAELRTASIKGALRFWWRALYGGDDIKDMKKREMYIFGSAEKNGLKSNVSINIAEDKIEKSESIWNEIDYIEKTNRSGGKYKVPKNFNDKALAYMFYSVMMLDDREYIKPGGKFDLILKTNLNENKKEEIMNALKALVYFGGLGARTRRGAGSFILDKFNDENIKTKLELAKKIKSEFSFLKQDSSKINYPSSVVSLKNCEIYIFENKKTWKEALYTISIPFFIFRNANKNKVDDTPNFGFPIIHKKRINGKKLVMIGEKINGNKKSLIERKASPLLFKVLKISQDNYFPMIIFFPMDALSPKSFNIIDKTKNISSKPNIKIIKDFLNSLPIKSYEKISL